MPHPPPSDKVVKQQGMRRHRLAMQSRISSAVEMFTRLMHRQLNLWRRNALLALLWSGSLPSSLLLLLALGTPIPPLARWAGRFLHQPWPSSPSIREADDNQDSTLGDECGEAKLMPIPGGMECCFWGEGRERCAGYRNKIATCPLAPGFGSFHLSFLLKPVAVWDHSGAK